MYSLHNHRLLTFNGRVGSHFPPSAHEGADPLPFGRGANVYDVYADRLAQFTLAEVGGPCVLGAPLGPPADALVRTTRLEWQLSALS